MTPLDFALTTNQGAVLLASTLVAQFGITVGEAHNLLQRQIEAGAFLPVFRLKDPEEDLSKVEAHTWERDILALRAAPFEDINIGYLRV